MSDGLGELVRSLHEEQPEIEALACMVAGSGEAIKLVIDGLTFPVDTYRYNCNRLIVEVAASHPELVYPYWRNLAGLLESSNTYHRCSAINVLPHLIPADGGEMFDRTFERYFELLDDESVIPPCYIARNCPTIASHLPQALQRIIDKLLSIDATHHEPGRKDLIKADIILALDRLYDRVENKSEVLRFVEDQLECSSPKTRKTARAFLKQHS
ncbi:MAG: hypothetical protein JXB06_04915 [Spirochaetales bacterium]|nr:hypothetical protein [Spirochaetales bacterium]